MIRKRVLFLVSVVLVLGLPARSQTSPVSIKSLIAAIDTFSSKLTPEKLYLQLDKPYYSIGDTIWFKAYLFDASFLTPSAKSGLVYIEIANDTNKVLLRRMLPVYSGLGSGNIALPKDEIPQGSYTIRAYTNLMRNFGEDRIFKKSFYVSGLANDNWLVSSNSILADSAGKTNIRLGLKLTMLNKQALGLKDLRISVMDGKRNILRDKVQTDAEGKLDINFNLPERSGQISIVAEDANSEKGPRDAAQKEQKIVIPVPVNRRENMDLQFMPEGGNMIAGIATRIGFKAIGEDGKGTDISGKVYDSKSNETSSFNSTHQGMGSFYLNPQAGETYTAKINLPDGTTKSYPLPKVQQTGTTLSIRNSKQSDSLEISVAVLASAGSTYYLIGQYGSVVCYAATIKSGIRMKVAKKLFSTGIAHFTLLDPDKKPVNERIVYIDHQDQLRISITPDKASYKTRDSIAVNIEVKDKDGKPVRGSFSLAVTDDNQVKTDSSANIQTNLLLTSDLKGTIEDPGYYFNNTNEAWEAMDNLLLTQGWVGYHPIANGWKDTFEPNNKIDFPAEHEFTIKGKVTNIFNKSLDGVKVAMISTKPLFFKDTTASKEGQFVFKDFPQLDSAAFRIQATNKRDKEFNVGIVAEEFKPPVFKRDDYQTIPWYMNTDTTLLNYVKNTITQKQEEFKFTGKDNVLNTVTITTKKIVKGSKNLNGEGGADMTLDEEDMKRAGKKSLLELIQEKIPTWMERSAALNHIIIHYGGTGGPFHVYKERYYSIGNNKANILIDGVALDQFYEPPPRDFPIHNDDYLLYIKRYLDYFTAEDIKGIELMKPGKYNALYNHGFIPVEWWVIELGTGKMVPMEYDDYLKGGQPIPRVAQTQSFIEITTRAGQGPWSMPTPGIYLYKTMPFAGSKQFYSPKYSIKDKPAVLPDLRSTIYWQPHVITDKEGRAMVSFYSADKPGTYTVITEGSNMNGAVGNQSTHIKILK